MALSNLLSSNIAIGMKFSLSMGYHDDVETRCAYMQVLTNILEFGSVDKFEGLAEEGQKIRNLHEKLVDLVTGEDMTIVNALSDVVVGSDIEELARVLLNIFECRGLSINLLESVVEKEVELTKSPVDLFRGNTMATKLLTLYAKDHGQGYLQSALTPLLKELVSQHPPLTFETNPLNLGPNDDLERNKRNLSTYSKSFLDAILGSKRKLPPSMTAVCAMISRVVGEKFPSNNVIGVGRFMFLRFVCPAIVAPESHELIIQTVTGKELKNGLKLIAREIHNLVNQISKELKPSPDDLYDLRIIQEFLEDLGVPRYYEVKNTQNRPDELDFQLLHHHLAKNIDTIERLLSSKLGNFYRLPIEETQLVAPVIKAKQIIGKLSTLIAQLGPVPEISKHEFRQSRNGVSESSGGIVLTNQQILEFMIRVESSPTGTRQVEILQERKILFEGPVSKNYRPVMYYITRRLMSDQFDFEVVLYFFLITMRSLMSCQYDIIVDGSKFKFENEWKIEWVERLMKLFPNEIVSNVETIIIYNCNSVLRKTLKKYQKILTNRVFSRIVFAVSISEIHEYVSPANLRLPATTLALEQDVNTVFSPIVKHSQFKSAIPVVIKISRDHLQVTTTKKVDVTGGQAILNDVYHISEIEDIFGTPSKLDDQEFVIRISEKIISTNGLSPQGKKTTAIIFGSAKKELIISAIRDAITRYQLLNSTKLLKDQTELRPSDVPGKILNMALLNICSDNPTLQTKSYNLLCAICSSYDYNVGNQLLSADGLFIPMNNHGFVTTISAKIAKVADNLTLDFLLECCLGLSRSKEEQKFSCIEYMSPWLPNLAVYCKGEINSKKCKEFLRMAIDLTVREKMLLKMGLFIQSNLWAVIGKVDSVMPFVIDQFLSVATHFGLGSVHCEILTNTIITLASSNKEIISGKVISRLRKVIFSTSTQSTKSLVESPNWVEICVLIRFILALSFNNNLDVHQFLPEILHTLTMLVGIGNFSARLAIHGIVVNVIQSLSTSIEAHKEDEISTLKLILTEISQPKLKIMFNCATKHNLLNTDNSEVSHSILPTNLEGIMKIFLDIVTFGAKNREISSVWRSRWMALVSSTTFQYNPSIQSRSFIVIGCLARENVDDDFLYQVLVALRNALNFFEHNENNLIESIIISLCNIVSGVSTHSRYLRPIFWLAVSLIQIGSISIFSSAIVLLETVTKVMSISGAFIEASLSNVMTNSRIPFLSVASQLDESNGILFGGDFTFALVATIMKGLSESSTKSATIETISTILEITSKIYQTGTETPELNTSVRPDQIAYLLALLPNSSKPEDVFWLAGEIDLNEELDFDIMDDLLCPTDIGFYGRWNPKPYSKLTKYRKLFHVLSIQNPVYVTMSCALLVSLLESLKDNDEILLIYSILCEAAYSNPHEFAPVWETLMPKVNTVIKNSRDELVLEAVYTLVRNSWKITQMAAQPLKSPNHTPAVGINSPIFSPGIVSPGNESKNSYFEKNTPPLNATTVLVSFLKENGLPGLFEGAKFKISLEKQIKNAKLACA
ncbi:Ras GTPase activating protein ira2, partial [Nowakowskiella sp. JEL0078]